MDGNTNGFLSRSIGSRVVIDLKTLDSVIGFVVKTDGYMNFKLRDVVYCERVNEDIEKGAGEAVYRYYKVDFIYIRGSNVNSVQFEDGVDEKIKAKIAIEKEKKEEYLREKNKNYQNKEKDKPVRDTKKEYQKQEEKSKKFKFNKSK